MIIILKRYENKYITLINDAFEPVKIDKKHVVTRTRTHNFHFMILSSSPLGYCPTLSTTFHIHILTYRSLDAELSPFLSIFELQLYLVKLSMYLS